MQIFWTTLGQATDLDQPANRVDAATSPEIQDSLPRPPRVFFADA